jgi:nucleoside-diphosphate-sugar epimerase
MSHRVLITGAAGYLGGMLCDQLSRRDDVDAIIGVDKNDMPPALHGLQKLHYQGEHGGRMGSGRR